jgi:hypothetical protein
MDIAVVVNLKARRGTERVVSACRKALPGARLLSTRTLDEAVGFAEGLRADLPQLLVSAGGDGTAVTLLTAMRGAVDGRSRALVDHPALAVLPLGTGNGWAHTLGAPRWRPAVERLGRLADSGAPLPLRRFELVEVCGLVAPFAGTGWDAEVLDDYHATRNGRLPKLVREGLPGYLMSLATRSVPRRLLRPRTVEVEVTNLGDDALVVDAEGRAIEARGGGPGAVLYRGPMSVCGSGTTSSLGFGFKAFPFAGSVPGRFCTRVYAAGVGEALVRLPSLWRGAHPLPHDHQWMLNHCRMTFSEPVPFQVGGDRLGMRTEVEYKLALQPVDVVNWRAVSAA